MGKPPGSDCPQAGARAAPQEEPPRAAPSKPTAGSRRDASCTLRQSRGRCTSKIPTARGVCKELVAPRPVWVFVGPPHTQFPSQAPYPWVPHVGWVPGAPGGSGEGGSSHPQAATSILGAKQPDGSSQPGYGNGKPRALPLCKGAAHISAEPRLQADLISCCICAHLQLTPVCGFSSHLMGLYLD